MSYRWEFYDPVLDVTYQVARNPDEMGGVYVSNRTASYGLSPIDGHSRLTRQPDAPENWEFSGITFNKAHYDALVEWCAKPYRVTLTDHLERVFSVRLLQFEAQPKNTGSFAEWKFRYTVKALMYPRGVVVVGQTASAAGSIPVPLGLGGAAATGTGAGIPGTLL